MASLTPFRLRIIDVQVTQTCLLNASFRGRTSSCRCLVGQPQASSERKVSARMLHGFGTQTPSLHGKRKPFQQWLKKHLHGTRSKSGNAIPEDENSAAAGVSKEPIIGEVTVHYSRGLPVITAPLPSRAEKCQFTLLPVSNTVGDFLHMLSVEDKGIDRAAVYSADGVRISSRTAIETLMEEDFELVLNDVRYRVITPEKERLSHEQMTTMCDVRNLVAQLYESLQVDQHQLQKERQLLAKLEKLKKDIEPMEERNKELAVKTDSHINTLTWMGLGLMAAQFGILARLTWWEYSWDIMEPVTYFVTYGTAMGAYAYYALTRQEYLLPDVRDREFLNVFHKNARKFGLDVEKYNALKQQQSDVEDELRRLRDPLQLKLAPKSLEAPLPADFPQGILSTVRQELLSSPTSSSSDPKGDPKP